MKFLFCAILIAGSAMAFTQLPATPGNADKAQVATDNNAFATDLYAHLRAQPGNVFFSPESISTAFAMAYGGARGETATEMAHVFHFSLPPGRLHPAMGALLAAMNASHDSYELDAADALWAQQDEHFLDDYLNLMQNDYGAALHRVDFRTSPEAVRATINQWVAQQTKDKIRDLIGPGVLTPLTRLVLTNAIYFKGKWASPFTKAATEEGGEFHLTATTTVKAPLMHRTGSYRFYDGGAFEALELPYQGGELAMVVLLPNDTDGLAALEQRFTAAAAAGWVEQLKPVEKVILTLPRFTMTQQFELSQTLAAMGMPRAFSRAADFSGMTGKPEFQISAAIHKAFVDVNEEGTEAAAATSTVMRSMAMRVSPPPIQFRADHPFLFLIRDTKTGSILFLGRVEDPSK